MAANAHPGADTIAFKAGLHGAITLGSELSIADDLTITGPGAGTLAVSGGGTTRVFASSGSTTNVSITGLTIADGRASAPAGVAYGGGLLNDGASVGLDHVVLVGNTATGDGAGGGAVLNLFGELRVSGSGFLGNRAVGGAGGAAGAGAVGGDGGFGAGGGILNGFSGVGDGSTDIADSLLSGNRATGGVGGAGGGNGGVGLGGGLYNGGGGTTTLRDGLVVNNRAGGGAGNGGSDGTGTGGGIYNDADSGSTVTGDLWLVFGNHADEFWDLFGAP